ncbi:MAG TPA: SDR family NAD(P)-dependent oxidoreductase [Alphaproteobacteria bacterium]|nr:SDR family NAD(P)-dependent oxidoreductase [Alphaproteobacteria bacterium]
MSGRLQGKRALIYGGGTGLGHACAAAMAAEGAAIFLSGRRVARLQEAAKALSATARVGYEAGDATLEPDVRRVTEAAVEFLGGLDTMVISAGASGITPILSASLEEFRAICDANLISTFLACRYGAPHMVANGSGSIIAVSSIFGLVGQVERVAYCASKHGVVGLVRAAALDLANKGVRVNALCPGFVETELAREIAYREPDPEAALERRRKMHPIPRSGLAEEVAEAAVYLASDRAAWTTGQAIAVDGGYTAR